MAAIIGRISAHEGYVGLTQAEAKFFISEGYLFLTLGVAWRIASDVPSDRSVGIWSRDEAVIGRLPSLTGPLSTAVAKITRSKHPNSQLLFFGHLETTKACNARLWIPHSERASIRC
jgi:hypothetical protein